MCNFVLLDLLCKEPLTGLYNPVQWVDKTNGCIIFKSLNDIMLYFEGQEGLFLNCNISENPVKENYSVDDVKILARCLGEEPLDIVNNLEDMSGTTQIITRCSRCGKWYKAVYNMGG